MCQGVLEYLERPIGIVLVEVIDAAEHGCRVERGDPDAQGKGACRNS